MKRILAGVSALVIGASLSAAYAADMALKAPPPPAAANCTWCGWYLGGEIGGAWATSRSYETTSLIPPATGNGRTYASGVVGGGHAGYNWQMNNIVAGFETDFEGTGLGKTNTCLIQDPVLGNVAPGTCFAPSYNFRTSLPWQGSIRGRLGYSWGNTLLYATGGFAYADIRTNYTTIAGWGLPGAQGFSQVRGGGTVGG
jgi:outer membrane immunogenic protein